MGVMMKTLSGKEEKASSGKLGFCVVRGNDFEVGELKLLYALRLVETSHSSGTLQKAFNYLVWKSYSTRKEEFGTRNHGHCHNRIGL